MASRVVSERVCDVRSFSTSNMTRVSDYAACELV